MNRIGAASIFSVLASFLSQPCWAQGEGIGTLPKTKPFLLAPASSAPAPASDLDGDGLLDSFEVITLQTDPLTPDIAGISVSPLNLQVFRLYVYTPMTGKLIRTGEIPFANLGLVTGKTLPLPLSAGGVQGQASKGGLIYEPIGPTTPRGLPLANMLCVQQTIAVGQVGATQLLLIGSSNCEPGPSSCQAS